MPARHRPDPAQTERHLGQRPCFQLRAVVEASVDGPAAADLAERAAIWPLPADRCRIGTDPSNEIRLRARGVSRFHAHIDVDARGCVLVDLESKNGTRVNGRAIQRQQLAVGDVLAIGTTRWVLESVAYDDVALALELDGRQPFGTTVHGITSHLGEATRRHTGLPYALLAALLGRLRQRPDADLEGCLVELVRYVEATGAGLVAWPVEDPPVVIGSVGELPELPARAALDEADALAIDPRLGKLMPSDDSLLLVPLPEKGVAGTTIGPGLLVGGLASDVAVLDEPLASVLVLLETSEIEEMAGDPSGLSDAFERTSAVRLPDGIVAGSSGAMAGVYAEIAQIASDPIPVLITGETGVGKEHVARALHATSSRRERPFVAINCAAIPAELLEAELFGIGRGVATGVQARRGKFQQADGGSLFLDEIGDLPLGLQTKLLRVLQEGEVTPVGETAVSVDVRLITATHRDVLTAIQDGTFRQDLYYRIAGYRLAVPALRDRPDDFSILLGHFLRQHGRSSGRRVRGVTVKGLEQLRSYPWPGNVRELQHVARRLVYLCPPGQAIDSSMVGDALDDADRPQSADAASPSNNFVLGTEGLDDHLAAIEKVALEQALERTEGNQSKAARLLRISRNSLARRIERLGLERQGRDREPDS